MMYIFLSYKIKLRDCIYESKSVCDLFIKKMQTQCQGCVRKIKKNKHVYMFINIYMLIYALNLIIYINEIKI